MTLLSEDGSIEPPPKKHWAVRAVRVVGGFALLIAGVAMLALPGPGWLAIGLGLTLLASEFRWARRLLVRLKKTLRKYVTRRPKASQRPTGDTDTEPQSRGSSDVNDTPTTPTA